MAENLGLAAFAKIIDGMILSHVESYFEQDDKEETEMKDNFERKMSALGISPSEIKGKFTYVNGDVYEREWKDDKIHGKGNYTFT